MQQKELKNILSDTSYRRANNAFADIKTLAVSIVACHVMHTRGIGVLKKGGESKNKFFVLR